MALPPEAKGAPQWQAAAEALLMAAEGRGPLMHARIGMLRALNHGKSAPVIAPRGKRAKGYRIIQADTKNAK
jgi:hypothetical protein